MCLTFRVLKYDRSRRTPHVDDLSRGLISAYNFTEVSSEIRAANTIYGVLKGVFENGNLKSVDERGLRRSREREGEIKFGLLIYVS